MVIHVEENIRGDSFFVILNLKILDEIQYRGMGLCLFLSFLKIFQFFLNGKFEAVEKGFVPCRIIGDGFQSLFKGFNSKSGFFLSDVGIRQAVVGIGRGGESCEISRTAT